MPSAWNALDRRTTPSATLRIRLRLAASLHATQAVQGFLREHYRKVAVISLLLLVPCFWHAELVAGDLASHTYNAWLVQLIARHQAPGVYLAPQWTNVLFDTALSGLGALLGVRTAERVVVPLVVLIFFWGVFAFLCAVTRRSEWRVVPLLAMFAYGWVFHMGFINYYLSVGLSFWGLALFWRGTIRERLASLALLPLILAAHLLGVLWFVGAAAYLLLTERLQWWGQGLLLAATISVMPKLRFYVQMHYPTGFWREPWEIKFGFDQIMLFGLADRALAWIVLTFTLICLVLNMVKLRSKPGRWKTLAVPFQLYAITIGGALILPAGGRFPSYPASVGFITQRLTLISAVLVCCLLSASRLRRWQFAGFCVLAAPFFGLLYHSAGQRSTMEQQLGRLLAPLPAGQRVIATIASPPESRITMDHVVDRACVGRCLSYGNYEPSSKQFRVRVSDNCPIVVDQAWVATAIMFGRYIVKPQDLPIYQVYQCSPRYFDLCLRPLRPGEVNGLRLWLE
jgi:hypothetical protein